MTDQDAPSTVQIPVPGTYQLDIDRSVIAFTTRHLFGLGKVHGTFGVTEGVIAVADATEDSAVRVRAAASTFSTGDRRRDELVTGRRFLDAGTHRELSFRSTSLTAGPDGSWTVHGELTAVGRSAPLDLTVTAVRQDGQDLHLEATGTVDRYAHGLTAARGLAARRLRVALSVRATR